MPEKGESRKGGVMEQKAFADKSRMRDSGIELLKVIAVVLIVISHVVLTLTTENEYIPYNDYLLDCTHATTNGTVLLLAVIRHFGALGNWIFFVASAWFLLDSTKASGKKIMEMLLDIWVISVLFLGITLLLRGEVSGKLFLFSLLPTTFENNWYLTCYLLFYPLHPYLNRLIAAMTQKEHLKMISVLTVLYIGFNFIKGRFFFPNMLLLWSSVYLILAYIKRYCIGVYSSAKVNGILLLCGAAGAVGIVLLTDLLGLKLAALSDQLLRWVSNFNPFLILIAITAFGLARKNHFKNKNVNHIAKCAMLIYIIHENILLRTYVRPYLWHCIFDRYGYAHILLWVFLYSAGWLLAALALSLLYEKSIQKLTARVSEKILKWMSSWYQKYESAMLKLH